MKKIYILFFLAISFTGLQSFSKADPINDVIDAIKKSNISLLASYFDQTVEVALPDKSNNYRKAQAEVVIKDFFSNNPVKSFNIEHKGNNNGSQYCIGHLVTSKGVFRLTIFMKQKSGIALVQEIRIENER